MTFTVSLGWWLAPAAVTLIAFAVYWRWERRQEPSYGYGAIGAGLGSALLLLCAVSVSAVAWIVYLSIRLWMA